MRQGDGWAPLAQREPDPQSPAGGVVVERRRHGEVDAAGARRRQLRGRAAGRSRGAPAGDQPAGGRRAALAPDARAGLLRLRLRRRRTRRRAGSSFSHSGGFNLGAGTRLPDAALGRRRHRRAQQRPADRRGRGDRADASCDLVQFGAGHPRLVCGGGAAAWRRCSRRWASSPAQAPPADPAPARALGRTTPAPIATTTSARSRSPARATSCVLKAGPEPMAFPLRHWSGDSFVFEPWQRERPCRLGRGGELRAGSPAPTLTVDTWNEHGSAPSPG